MSEQSGLSWYARVPKVELHLHLEGSIPLPALWELVQKYGGDPLIPDLAALEKQFQFRDFRHFIETWTWKNQFLKEYADFTLISEAVARDLAAQNIRYAEMFYSPSDFFRHNLKIGELTAAIRAGFARVGGLEIKLICDVVRDRGIKNAAANLAEINEIQELGVIGITIGGSEQAFPPEPFAEVYASARQMGLHTSAHAGEAAGPASVWGAIQALRVERIGHATRAIEDPRLIEYLAEKQIPLEVCPISNLKTRVVDSLLRHPVRLFWEKGLLFSINTDDPKMFGNSLAGEYAALVEDLGFSRDDIRKMILDGIRSAWLSEKAKDGLIQEFSHSPDWRSE
jgi:adenosine deaminase